MNYKIVLAEKFRTRKATIGVIGLGYVGLPLALRLTEVFEKVIGFDNDPDKIQNLGDNRSYIKQIDSSRIKTANLTGFLSTTDFSRAKECDALLLCVPTPLTKHHEPDLGFIRITLETLQPHLTTGQLLSLESTTFPGTTDEIIVPRIEVKGFTIGSDFFVVYSPEREDPGNPEFNTRTIPKVIGGYTKECLTLGIELYSQAIDSIVPVSTTRAAEMTKLLENIYRAVNIGLVNEMKMVADKMGVNIYEVIDAASTKPFGFTKFTPGPGLGGHCIPIDPYYLTWKAKEYNISTRFIELSGDINRNMPNWTVEKLMHAFNEREKPIKNSKILIAGIAYKKNIDDARESPAIKIMELLKEKGALISYSDPHIQSFPKMRDHSFNLKSIPITQESIESFDAIILATDHDEFDYNLILNHARLIVDCRNTLKDFDTSSYKNIVLA